MFVAEVTDEGGGKDAKAIGDGGMKVDEFDQQGQKDCVNQGDPTIDEVTFEIFRPTIASGMKYNIFVAEEGVGKGDDCRGYDENEIMDARIQEIVKRRINECSEDRVPSSHDKIPQGLVLRRSKKSQYEFH